MDPEVQQNQEPRPGLGQRIADFLEADRKKLGGMSPGAYFRLGLAELREAFSFGGNIAQPTPLGMYGTLTPGEVGTAREENANLRQMEEEPLRPSDIARDSGLRGVDHGQDKAFSKPSDIVRDRGPDGADQEQSKGHEKPSEIARDNSRSGPEREDGQERGRDVERGR
jgi:hypothetical protein